MLVFNDFNEEHGYFGGLPPELVLHTVSTLHSARDIYALMSINRGLYQLLKKYLYQHHVDHARKQHQLVRLVGIGKTILHVTAQQHDKLYIMMILLRDSRMDVNATGTEGRTPRSDPNLTSHGLSPLAIAAGSGLMELLEILLSDQRVALNSQIQGSEGNSLRLLYAPNVNVNCCWYTISALMWGILLEQTAVVVEILKKDQIDVNHRDGAGRTALMFAIEQRNDEVSKVLLNRKDMNLILDNVREESALDYVLKSGNSKDVGRDQKIALFYDVRI
ncbi:ankyrin repeat-containing domain protein [Aspergillus spectabilis]